MPWTGALVLGAGLAMSSTAIVLPMLAERDLLQSRAGRDGFAVLLFQDMAFIPLVALVPLLAERTVARLCRGTTLRERRRGDRSDPGWRPFPGAAAVPPVGRCADAGNVHRRHRC